MSTGRHRRQTSTARAAAAIVTSGAFAAVPLVGGAQAVAEPAPEARDAPGAGALAPVPVPVPPDGAQYTVRPGDTLSGVAASRGLDWESLWAANRAEVADPGAIRPGARLRLPAADKPVDKPTPGGPTTAAPKPSPKPGTAANRGAPAKPATAGKQTRIELTGYSWHDNTPAGSSAVSSPILHRTAGGQGTYADPITVAVPGSGGRTAVKPGTRFYLPTVRRYVIVEDSGASPASSGGTHLDVWIDGRDGSRSAAEACMNRITGSVSAEVNPPAGRPVMAGPIYSGGVCRIPKG